MKRTLFLFSALLVSAVLAMPTYARAEEESVVLSVATVSAEAGSTVDVTVSLRNCVSVDSTEFDLNYDAAALSVVSVTPGDVFPAQYCIAYTEDPGVVRVACARALGFSGDGVILTIRFQLLGDVGSPLIVTSHLSGDLAGKEVTWVDEASGDYEQYSAWVTVENGGVSVGDLPLPTSAVTPWVPATPVPTPSPTPEVTATPQEPSTPEVSASLSPAAPVIAASLNPNLVYVGGGLLLAVVILVVVLVSSKKRRG